MRRRCEGDLPGTTSAAILSFTVNGAVPPADLGLRSLGAELILAKNLSLLARFEGTFAPGTTSSAGIGTIRWNW